MCVDDGLFPGYDLIDEEDVGVVFFVVPVVAAIRCHHGSQTSRMHRLDRHALQRHGNVLQCFNGDHLYRMLHSLSGGSDLLVGSCDPCHVAVSVAAAVVLVPDVGAMKEEPKPYGVLRCFELALLHVAPDVASAIPAILLFELDAVELPMIQSPRHAGL